MKIPVLHVPSFQCLVCGEVLTLVPDTDFRRVSIEKRVRVFHAFNMACVGGSRQYWVDVVVVTGEEVSDGKAPSSP